LNKGQKQARNEPKSDEKEQKRGSKVTKRAVIDSSECCRLGCPDTRFGTELVRNGQKVKKRTESRERAESEV